MKHLGHLALALSTIALLASALACGDSTSSGGGGDDNNDTTNNDTTNNDTTNNDSSNNDTANNTGAITCEDFTPCGGDAVGTWTFDDFCIGELENPFAELCPTSTFDASTVGLSGSLVVDAAGTYTIEATNVGSIVLGAPNSCLEGFQLDCASLQDTLREPDDEGEVSDWSCEDDGTVCNCSLSQTGSSSETGSWTVAGNQITVVDDEDGSETVNDFCVQGSSMGIREVDPEGDPAVIILSR